MLKGYECELPKHGALSLYKLRPLGPPLNPKTLNRVAGITLRILGGHLDSEGGGPEPQNLGFRPSRLPLNYGLGFGVYRVWGL